jgi:intracellular sulfur oxidation DsrE/DsrF family protein
MRTRLILAGLSILLSVSTAARAQTAAPGFWATPTIAGYGRMHYERNFAYQPDPGQVYKIVFEVTKTPADPKAVNAGLDHVARAVNLYVAAGVPLGHLHFVAILEGDSAPISLSNEAYRARFGSDNPNLPLIETLRAHGVDVAVCAQAAALHDIAYASIDRSVTIALSALTTVSTLEHQGYGLVPQ